VFIELEKVFFGNRVVSLRNNLPVCTDFTSLSKFSSRSLYNDYLLKYRKAFFLNFTYRSNSVMYALSYVATCKRMNGPSLFIIN